VHTEHPRRNAPIATFTALEKCKIGIDPVNLKPKILSSGGKTHTQKPMLKMNAKMGLPFLMWLADRSPCLGLGAAFLTMVGSQRDSTKDQARAMRIATTVCCPVILSKRKNVLFKINGVNRIKSGPERSTNRMSR
jgi:hypothetical protein